MKPHLPSVLNRETLDRRIEISFHHSLRPCEPQVRAAATTGLGVGGGGGGEASVRPCKAGDWLCWHIFCGQGSEDKAGRKRSTINVLSAGPNLSPQRLALGNTWVFKAK